MASVHSNGTSWHAVVALPGGRTVRLGVGGKASVTREQAEQAAARIEQAAETAADLHARPTLAACCDLWIGHRPWAPLTLRSHRRILRSVCDALPGVRAADVTALDLVRWRAGIAGCEATRCKASRVVRAMFRWLTDSSVIDRSPARTLRDRPPVVPPEEKWTPADPDAVMQAARATSPAATMLCGLILYTGMRRGEAIRLRWPDVLPDRIVIRTERGVEGSKQRHRTCRIDAELRAVWGGAPREIPPCGILHPTPSVAGRLIAAVGERLGAPLTANSMRRWRAASWRRMYPDYVVNAWLGHTEAVARAAYLNPTEEHYRG